MSIFCIIESFKLLNDAVRAVITDEGFNISSEKAVKSRLCAERLLEWMDENKGTASDFSDAIYVKLKSCCLHQRSVP